MFFVLACLALAGSVLALRRSWSKAAERVWCLPLAFGLVAVAAACAAQDSGWERGVALALIAPAAPAYAVVTANATWRPARQGPERADGDEPAAVPQLALRWVLAGLGGGIASVALAVALAAWLPASSGLRTVLAVLSVPVTWALLAGWVLGTRRPVRVLAVIVACTLGGAAAWFR